MKHLQILLFLLIAYICDGQQNIKYAALDLDSIFKENQGTFVLYKMNTDQYMIYNYSRAATEYAVHSTSKIFWSIIGLEEGLIKNEEELIRWDSIKYPRMGNWPGGWAADQTVFTALKKSVNWYYFELLSLMTPELIEKYLNKLDYKQGFQVEKVHYFGLTYNIKKSALEQIDFLKRIYTNELKISDKTLATIKKGMLYQKTDQYTMYSRTGLGPIENGNGIGWFIGFIEKGNEVYYFALNVEDEDEGESAKLRFELSLRVLILLQII